MGDFLEMFGGLMLPSASRCFSVPFEHPLDLEFFSGQGKPLTEYQGWPKGWDVEDVEVGYRCL